MLHLPKNTGKLTFFFWNDSFLWHLKQRVSIRPDASAEIAPPSSSWQTIHFPFSQGECLLCHFAASVFFISLIISAILLFGVGFLSAANSVSLGTPSIKNLKHPFFSICRQPKEPSRMKTINNRDILLISSSFFHS